MSTNSNETDEKKDHSFNLFLLAIFAVLAIWLFNAFGFQFINPSLESRAQNGDMFGPTNALFSGLAFAGLIYTIVMQRKELEMQRNELRMQRQAMQGATVEQNRQATAQQEQLAALIKQNQLTTLTHDIERSKLRLDMMHKTISFSRDPAAKHHQFAEDIQNEYERFETVFNRFYTKEQQSKEKLE